MGPKIRSAERRSRAFGLDLVAVRSEIVVSKWCSPYYQTRSSPGSNPGPAAKVIPAKAEKEKRPGELPGLLDANLMPTRGKFEAHAHDVLNRLVPRHDFGGGVTIRAERGPTGQLTSGAAQEEL
jgi:hypothetical protein